MCFSCMTFFGCEDEYDTDIPNSSQISYRHHVPAATLLCLNVYCQYVLSSKANFNKFCSELWLVWKNRCLKSGTKLYGCPNWKKVCYPIWCQSPHGKKHYNHIKQGKRLNKNLHIFVHQSIHSKRQSQEIEIH